MLWLMVTGDTEKHTGSRCAGLSYDSWRSVCFTTAANVSFGAALRCNRFRLKDLHGPHDLIERPYRRRKSLNETCQKKDIIALIDDVVFVDIPAEVTAPLQASALDRCHR